jgi:uncharacterized protein
MSIPTPAPRPRLRELVQRHPLTTFYAFSYAAAWSLWTPLVVFRDQVPGGLGILLAMLGSLVPSTAGILFTGVLWGRQGVRELLGRLLKGGVGLRWYLAVLALPLLVPLGLGGSILLGGSAPVVDVTVVAVLVQLAMSIFPGSALGEELGWRGLALPLLQARSSALRASLVVGVLWGCWHLPLSLTGSDLRPLSLFPAFVLSVIAASVICTWMYNSTGGSLLVVVLYHATSNLPLTFLLEPLVPHVTQPFLVYTALAVAAAVVVAVATGPEHLSRTHHRQVLRTVPPARPAAELAQPSPV